MRYTIRCTNGATYTADDELALDRKAELCRDAGYTFAVIDEHGHPVTAADRGYLDMPCWLNEEPNDGD